MYTRCSALADLGLARQMDQVTHKVCRIAAQAQRPCQGSSYPGAQLQSRCSICHLPKASAGRGRYKKSSTTTRRGRTIRVQARAEDLEVQDRVLGALPYVVPLLDGIRYGRYFFLQFPAAAQLLAPLRPLISLYYSVPFASLILFFGLYAGLVNNYNFSRHVRFNAMQAILLDVLLVFPSLIEQVVRGPLGGAGVQLQINLYNTTWLFVAVCVAYASGSSLLGTVARLPLISGAADQRVP